MNILFSRMPVESKSYIANCSLAHSLMFRWLLLHWANPCSLFFFFHEMCSYIQTIIHYNFNNNQNIHHFCHLEFNLMLSWCRSPGCKPYDSKQSCCPFHQNGRWWQTVSYLTKHTVIEGQTHHSLLMPTVLTLDFPSLYTPQTCQVIWRGWKSMQKKYRMSCKPLQILVKTSKIFFSCKEHACACQDTKRQMYLEWVHNTLKCKVFY